MNRFVNETYPPGLLSLYGVAPWRLCHLDLSMLNPCGTLDTLSRFSHINHYKLILTKLQGGVNSSRY